MRDNQIFLEILNNLLSLSDNVLNDMQAADNIMRLRTSTEQLISINMARIAFFISTLKEYGGGIVL